jgi:leucyl aminopeptidase
VLEDCITHARDQRAERLVDRATLKGGIVGALGSMYGGLKGNDDELCGVAAAAGGAIGDRVWRRPLDPLDDERIKGRYADISNLPEARTAHLITVGALLHWFAGDVPWAHLDIAGVSDGAGARMRARARGRAAAARARAPPRD